MCQLVSEVYGRMKLKKARADAKQSQEQIASDAGLSANGYRKLERGEVDDPHVQTMYGVARALGVDPHEIDEFKPALKRFDKVSVIPIPGQKIPRTRTSVGVPGQKVPGEVYRDEDLHAEIRDLISRQQRLLKEQQEIANRLEVIESKIAAQAIPTHKQ